MLKWLLTLDCLSISPSRSSSSSWLNSVTRIFSPTFIGMTVLLMGMVECSIPSISYFGTLEEGVLPWVCPLLIVLPTRLVPGGIICVYEPTCTISYSTHEWFAWSRIIGTCGGKYLNEFLCASYLSLLRNQTWLFSDKNISYTIHSKKRKKSQL